MKLLRVLLAALCVVMMFGVMGFMASSVHGVNAVAAVAVGPPVGLTQTLVASPALAVVAPSLEEMKHAYLNDATGPAILTGSPFNIYEKEQVGTLPHRVSSDAAPNFDSHLYIDKDVVMKIGLERRHFNDGIAIRT